MEAELERIGHADDLEDPPLDEPVRPGAHGRLAHAELGGDLGERAPAVLLEVLDDPLVELGDLVARAGPGDAVGHGVIGGFARGRGWGGRWGWRRGRRRRVRVVGTAAIAVSGRSARAAGQGRDDRPRRLLGSPSGPAARRSRPDVDHDVQAQRVWRVAAAGRPPGHGQRAAELRSCGWVMIERSTIRVRCSPWSAGLERLPGGRRAAASRRGAWKMSIGVDGPVMWRSGGPRGSARPSPRRRRGRRGGAAGGDATRRRSACRAAVGPPDAAIRTSHRRRHASTGSHAGP